MTERPILFSAPMVRAILEGTKTQTRRTVKVANHCKFSCFNAYGDATFTTEIPESVSHYCKTLKHDQYAVIKNRYGLAGDQLWVRENFSREDTVPLFQADHKEGGTGIRWKPSIHMPRRISRIQLEIKDVRIERLQEISADDAVSEGSYLHQCSCFPKPKTPIEAMMKQTWCHVHGEEYKSLWKTINGTESWDQNPYVWVIEFKRIRP